MLLAGNKAYLTGRNELQRPQRGLHIWDVGLQIVEGVCDTALELGRLLPRGTCRRDLVEGSHNCGRGVTGYSCPWVEIRAVCVPRFCVGV